MRSAIFIVPLLLTLAILVGCDSFTRVQGTVVDSEGKPLNGASVHLEIVGGNQAKEVSTQEGGRFTLQLSHSPWTRVRAELTVSKPGYDTYTQQVQAGKLQSLRITLNLTKAGPPK